MSDPRLPQATGESANTFVTILLALMHSKLKFLAAIGVVFVAGLFYANGLTTSTIVISTIAAVIIGFFAALVWFWTAILTSSNSQKKP
jgi:hypothetical protein